MVVWGVTRENTRLGTLLVEKTEAKPEDAPESRGIAAALSVFRIRDYRFLWGAMFAASQSITICHVLRSNCRVSS